MPQLGNCDIFMKRKILVINETKQDEILLKLKVYDRENLRRKYCKLSLKLEMKVDQLSVIFQCMYES